jgi:hypothetical protein
MWFWIDVDQFLFLFWCVSEQEHGLPWNMWDCEKTMFYWKSSMISSVWDLFIEQKQLEKHTWNPNRVLKQLFIYFCWHFEIILTLSWTAVLSQFGCWTVVVQASGGDPPGRPCPYSSDDELWSCRCPGRASLGRPWSHSSGAEMSSRSLGGNPLDGVTRHVYAALLQPRLKPRLYPRWGFKPPPWVVTWYLCWDPG